MSTPDLVNMFEYLQNGKPFSKKRKIRGLVTAKSLVGYSNYTQRDDAKNAKEELLFMFNGGGFFEYTSREGSRKIKTGETKTFTNNGWIKTFEEKEKFKEEIKKSFSTKGNIAWIPVSSFKDYTTAAQYGLFKEEDYAAIISVVLPKFFKYVGLDEKNMLWWSDYHNNKNHPHNHLVFLEKKQTRKKPTFTRKEINQFKGYLFSEMEKRQAMLTNSKNSSLDILKEKDNLYKEVQKKSKDFLLKDTDLQNDIKTFLEKLPDKNKSTRLQYNSIHMKPFRDEVDKIVEKILSDEKIKDEYSLLLEKLKKLDEIKSKKLNTTYTNYQDNETKKIKTYLANQVLQLKKEYQKNIEEEKKTDLEIWLEKNNNSLFDNYLQKKYKELYIKKELITFLKDETKVYSPLIGKSVSFSSSTKFYSRKDNDVLLLRVYEDEKKGRVIFDDKEEIEMNFDNSEDFFWNNTEYENQKGQKKQDWKRKKEGWNQSKMKKEHKQVGKVAHHKKPYKKNYKKGLMTKAINQLANANKKAEYELERALDAFYNGKEFIE